MAILLMFAFTAVPVVVKLLADGGDAKEAASAVSVLAAMFGIFYLLINAGL